MKFLDGGAPPGRARFLDDADNDDDTRRVQNARIAEYALAAADYVRQSLKVELDGSVESLAFVDHYLSKVGNISDEVLALLSAAIGCYFGELVIGKLGGEWRTEGDDPAGWTVMLEAAPITFHPVAMAAEAVRQADLEDYDAGIQVPANMEGPLEEALAAVGDVEADYYYSLTGRLETLEHVAEVLAELRRQAQEETDKTRN